MRSEEQKIQLILLFKKVEQKIQLILLFTPFLI